MGRFESLEKAYEVDTGSSEEGWHAILKREKSNILKIQKEVLKAAEINDTIVRMAINALGIVEGRIGQRYMREITDACSTAGYTKEETWKILIGNLVYDMSQITKVNFGCTSAVVSTKNQGLVHIRNLDWPAKSLGKSTIGIKMRSPVGDYFSISFPGFFGVLTAVAPGRFSVSINWAPPSDELWFLNKNPSPPFYLRHVMETAKTFDDAVRMLSEAHLSCSVFFTVCGTKKEEAAVVEVTALDHTVSKYRSSVRYLRGEAQIVQGNHFQSGKFEALNESLSEDNDGLYVITDSLRRVKKLSAAIRKQGKEKASDFLKMLSAYPVSHEETLQKVVMHPGKGLIKVMVRK